MPPSDSSARHSPASALYACREHEGRTAPAVIGRANRLVIVRVGAAVRGRARWLVAASVAALAPSASPPKQSISPSTVTSVWPLAGRLDIELPR